MDLTPAQQARVDVASRLLWAGAAGALMVAGMIVALAMGWLP